MVFSFEIFLIASGSNVCEIIWKRQVHVATSYWRYWIEFVGGLDGIWAGYSYLVTCVQIKPINQIRMLEILLVSPCLGSFSRKGGAIWVRHSWRVWWITCPSNPLYDTTVHNCNFQFSICLLCNDWDDVQDSCKYSLARILNYSAQISKRIIRILNPSNSNLSLIGIGTNLFP